MYATAAAFKTALEQRLRDSSKSGVELARRRQLLVFDRLDCARHARARKAAMLKGGLVLELRLETARTTRDVDCALSARRRPLHWRKRATAGGPRVGRSLPLAALLRLRFQWYRRKTTGAPYAGSGGQNQ